MSHLNFLGIHMHMQPIGGRVYQANTSDQSQVFHGNYHKGVLQPLGGRVHQANTSDQSQVFHGNYHKGVLHDFFTPCQRLMARLDVIPLNIQQLLVSCSLIGFQFYPIKMSSTKQ